MMHIITNSGMNGEWHIGEQCTCPDIEPRNVAEVQADGDELGYIYNHFSNLPKVMLKRVVRFFGDNAKFIVANL